MSTSEKILTNRNVVVSSFAARQTRQVKYTHTREIRSTREARKALKILSLSRGVCPPNLARRVYFFYSLIFANLKLLAVYKTPSCLNLLFVRTVVCPYYRCLIYSLLIAYSSLFADNSPSTQINKVVSHPTLPLTVTAHEDRHIRFFDNSTGKWRMTHFTCKIFTFLDLCPASF